LNPFANVCAQQLTNYSTQRVEEENKEISGIMQIWLERVFEG
jgi:hypothetical protein